MHRVTLNAGERLYQEGDPAGDAYLILSGEVVMHRTGTTVAASKGTVVGLQALVGRPYGSTARAVEQVHVLAFSRRELRALFRSDPDRALQIVDGIIELLGKVNEVAHTQEHASDMQPASAE